MHTSAAFPAKRIAWRLAALATLAGSAVAPSVGCSSPSHDMGASSSQAVGSTGLVISALYGAGGNTGAAFKNDFVELFNRGTEAVALDGMSIQYGSKTGNVGASGSVVALPAGVTIAPGRYFLIQLNGGANGAALPTPDLSSTAINMSGTDGKIALANVATPLNCGGTVDGGTNRCSSPNIVDMVGYGTASDFEGPAGSAVGALSVTTSGARNGAGCIDTDVNSADFTIANPAVAPRNQATPAAPCSSPSDAGDDSASDAGSSSDATPDAADDGASADGGSDDASSDDASSDDGGSEDGGSDDASSDDGGSVDSGPIPPGDGDGLVISQVFGGGGNNGSPLDRDFVELFNRGSKPASLKGLSIQYGSSNRDFGAPLADGGPSPDILLLPDTTVRPGQYLLVGLNSNNLDAGAALPTVDVSGNVALSSTNGKVALVRISTGLGCGGSMRCPTTNIVDMVGYGTASDFEGTAAAGQLSNTTAALRKGDGCIDNDMNNADFDIKAPAPRNTATSAHKCTSGGHDAGEDDDDAGNPPSGDDGGSLGGNPGRGSDGGSTHTDGGPVEDTFGGGSNGGCAMETAQTPGGPIALAFAAFGFIAARRRRRS
jgi:MYXO-CTERM domain-containing protein